MQDNKLRYIPRVSLRCLIVSFLLAVSLHYNVTSIVIVPAFLQGFLIFMYQAIHTCSAENANIFHLFYWAEKTEYK